MNVNGWPKWNRNISWSIKNFTIERLSSNVTWEEPITDFYSELVEIPRMPSLSDIKEDLYQRIDCPHEWSNLSEWHDSSTWNNYGNIVPDTTYNIISIPENKSVIIRSCSLDNNFNNTYQRIYIPTTSKLIFDDADIDIHFKEIWVDGELYAGNINCRLYSKINFYFHGNKNNSRLGTSIMFDDDSSILPNKGIVTNGNIQIHGKQYHPTWTKLAISVYPGDDRLYLQESVNWEVGQEIVVVTSIYQDYQDYHENERMIIVSIGDSNWTTNNVLYFGDDQRFNYYHYAGLEYQTEVLLLTRRIVFQGIDTDENVCFLSFSK